MMYEFSKARAVLHKCLQEQSIVLDKSAPRHVQVVEAYKLLRAFKDHEVMVNFGIAQTVAAEPVIVLYTSSTNAGYHPTIDIFALDVELSRITTLTSQQAIGAIDFIMSPKEIE